MSLSKPGFLSVKSAFRDQVFIGPQVRQAVGLPFILYSMRGASWVLRSCERDPALRERLYPGGLWYNEVLDAYSEPWSRRRD
jgi:hypothetical protein